jgi:8-oxo-dGTP pyrophosphatase MutT (NUDIX family)
MTPALLDPRPAAAAGAPHGQLASAVAGGLRLSCHKLVEDAARATILLVPGLLRLDVRPLEDSLQVFARALHPVPPRWELVGGSADEPESDEPYRLDWRVDAAVDPRPVRGRVVVAMTVDFDRGVAHFVAQAVFREVSA